MPLADQTIVVTRDTGQASAFIKSLRALGANVVSFPTIKITGPDNQSNCRAKLKKIADFDWIIFTSSNAVKYVLRFSKAVTESFQGLSIACIGESTADILSGIKIKPVLTPEFYNTPSLIKALSSFDLKKKRILLPVSNLANHILEKKLTALGANVERLEVYKTVPYHNPQKNNLTQKIYNQKIDCITFFSPSAFTAFAELMGDEVLAFIKRRQVDLAAIGPATAKVIQVYGLQSAIQPQKSTVPGLIDALMRYYAGKMFV